MPGLTPPFRVFCGWDNRQAEAAEVFAFSVRENATVGIGNSGNINRIAIEFGVSRSAVFRIAKGIWYKWV